MNEISDREAHLIRVALVKIEIGIPLTSKESAALYGHDAKCNVAPVTPVKP
jgi:hypothetical protein